MEPMEINRALEGGVLGQEPFQATPKDERLAEEGKMRGWVALLKAPGGPIVEFVPACRWRLEEGGTLGSREFTDLEEFTRTVGEPVAKQVLERDAIVEVEIPAGEHLTFLGLCRTEPPIRVSVSENRDMLLFEASPFARINEAIDAQIRIQEDPTLRETIVNKMQDFKALEVLGPGREAIVGLIEHIRRVADFACVRDPNISAPAALEEIRGDAESRRTSQVDPACLSLAEMEWLLVRWADGNWNEAINWYRRHLVRVQEERIQAGLPVRRS